ncbi:MAG: helix-turn-helix transcriptional regulator [Ignavibacteria bacterium]|nr:helix-turn-helix transcriptional regulator [Ignavibacteria bacterium]
MSTTQTNRNTDTRNDESEQHVLTSREFTMILRKAGYNHAEMARHLGRSRSYVSNIANGMRTMTLRHATELREFLGESLYRTALALVRKEQTERDRTVAEQRQREIERRRTELQEEARQQEERRRLREEELRAELESSGDNESSSAG